MGCCESRDKAIPKDKLPSLAKANLWARGDSSKMGGGSIMQNVRSKLVNIHTIENADSSDDENDAFTFKNDRIAETCHNLLKYRFKAELAKLKKDDLKSPLN